MRDQTLVGVVVHLHEEAAWHLVQVHGLVEVVPAPGEVGALPEHIGQLDFFGEQVKGVGGTAAR